MTSSMRLLRHSAPNTKKEHNLATMRRGYPAFFVQGGSAARRWETRNDASAVVIASEPKQSRRPHMAWRAV